MESLGMICTMAQSILKTPVSDTDDNIRVTLRRGAQDRRHRSPMIQPPYQVNDRFELVELLGSGNFSDVYLARDRDPGDGPELVAFKLFRPQRKGRQLEHSLSTFEFQMLSRLRHPNLATVYDYGVDPGSGRAYFTMERISGVDFLEAVSRMTALEMLPLVVDVCRALHHIHTRGLIHHDLKPGNLIISQSNRTAEDRPRIKLTDFGLSTPFELADDGHLRGTPEYMAPEMLAGREKDHRGDLYSLGVLLYIGLSGRLPFPDGRRPGSEEQEIPPLRTRNKEPLPAFLEDLVARLLQVDPADRYQTANEVIQDLGLYTGTAWALEPGAVGASSAVADTVFTVSSQQLQGLHARLEQLGSGKAGSCTPALLLGGPGSGKSHLVMELRRLAQMSGTGFFFHSPLEDTAAGGHDQQTQTGHLIRQISDLRRSQRSGVTVVLDVEEHGFAAVSNILNSPATREDTFVLVTGTPGRPSTRQLLQAHPPGGELEHIALRPLDRELMARFLSLLLGNQVDTEDSLTACVLAESDGIPLLAEETVAHLTASGALALNPSGPVFDPEQHWMDFTPPTGHLRTYHQLAATTAGNRALQALAVFGGPATAGMVEKLTEEDGGEAAVAPALSGADDELLVTSMINEMPVYGFRSLLARNLVIDGLDGGRRREYNLRAATALQQGEPAPGVAPESLTWLHLMLAGETLGAWQAGLEHGRRLEEALWFSEADRVYMALIADGGAGFVPPDLAVELLLRAANLARAAGQTGEARNRLDQGENLAVSAGLDQQLARIRLEKGYLLEKQGNLEEARETYLQGLEQLPGDNTRIHGDILLQLGLNALWNERFDEVHQRLISCRAAYQDCDYPNGEASCLFLEAYSLKCRQRPDEAIGLLSPWLENDRKKGGDSVMSGRLRILLGDLLYHQNKFDEAARLFGEGMDIFKDRGERNLEAITLANLGALHFEQGRFATAGHFNLDCLRAHEQVGNRYGQALSQYNLGVCYFHRGRYADALEHLRAARGIREFLGDTQGLAQIMNMEAELYLTLGDTARAAERLQQSAAVLPGGEGGGFSAADRLLLEAELALRSGRPDTAGELCGRAAKLFTSLGDTRQQVRTALLNSRCLAARGLAREAEEALASARSGAGQMNAPRLQAELLLAESEARNQFGLGPSHDLCIDRFHQMLDDLAEVDDPDFIQSLHAALGRHLEQTGRSEEAMAAFRRSFDLLRKVAGRFGSRHAEWKSGYLYGGGRADVVRMVAEWSRKKNPPDHSSRP